MGAGLALVAAACGGGGGGGGGGGQGAQTNIPKDTGKPVQGGSLTYGLEAETLGGWCLPDAQLAAGGIQVEQAVYDTLTVPNDKGEFVPYLAKSVTSSNDLKTWTVELRDGIQFHNGEPFNADAVKLNFDRYRKGVLFGLFFADLADVQATGPMTVTFTTKVPWVNFPAFLWGNPGRVGMVAPAQLNDTEGCPRNLIGTGPFKLQEWVPNDHLTGDQEPELLAEGQGRQRAAVPRPDHVPPRVGHVAACERIEGRRPRPHPGVRRAADHRAAQRRQGRHREDARDRPLGRDRAHDAERRQAAVRQPERPVGGRVRH